MVNTKLKSELETLKRSDDTPAMEHTIMVRLNNDMYEWLNTTYGKNKGELIRRLLTEIKRSA